MDTKKPNVKSSQDMPPKGGFPKIPTQRGIRPRGPSGFVIWATIFGMTAFGFHRIGKSGRENRLHLKEKREARMATLSFLQAEKDQEMAAKVKEALVEEAEIMKDVKDWVVGESVKSKNYEKNVSE